MKTGLIVGKKSICAHLDISEYTFGKFIKLGLPARFEDGRWYAHVENIEGWVKHFTRHQEKQDYDEINPK